MNFSILRLIPLVMLSFSANSMELTLGYGSSELNQVNTEVNGRDASHLTGTLKINGDFKIAGDNFVILNLDIKKTLDTEIKNTQVEKEFEREMYGVDVGYRHRDLSIYLSYFFKDHIEYKSNTIGEYDNTSYGLGFSYRFLNRFVTGLDVNKTIKSESKIDSFLINFGVFYDI